MQFTSTIIVALLLAVSTSSTVTAAQNTSNLRSGGRKLQDELTLRRELGACGRGVTIQSGDTCDAIRNDCGGDWASLDCDQAGTTCTEENSKLIAGDSCTLSTCDFPITIQSGDTCEDIVDTCGGLGLGLECDSAGSTYETCNDWGTKVTVGDSCKPLTACKVVNGEEDLHAEEYLCGGCGEQYTCCEHPGNYGHPGMYYYCN